MSVVRLHPRPTFAVVIRDLGEPEGLFHVAAMRRDHPGATAEYDGPVFGPGTLDIARLAASAGCYGLSIVEAYAALAETVAA